MELDFGPAATALASGDRSALAQELVSLFPADPDVAFADEFAAFALGARRRPDAHSPFASYFLDSIDRVRQRLGRGSLELPCPDVMEIGREIDFIGDYDRASEWSIPQCLNQLMLQRLWPSRSACVVSTMRDDGIYILEWVAYYRAIGLEHIFIYTNNNSDGSEQLLRKLARHKIITLIESETSGNVGPEEKAYGHSLYLLNALRDFEWVLYIDSDEYLVLAPKYQHNINSLIQDLHGAFPGRLPAGVCFPWMWMVSGMAFHRTDGLMVERFQHGKPHSITKALVRLADVVSMRNSHFPHLAKDGFLVDSAFKRLPDDVTETWKLKSPQYAGGRVNHYWPRSFEEFAIKKARARNLNLEVNLYDRPFELFFEWNDYETDINFRPIDPALLDRIKTNVGELRRLEGVGELADQLSERFPHLLRGYYGDGAQLRRLYDNHSSSPKTL